jgi:hypothetical protein
VDWTPSHAIFNFADFERGFGRLATDSELSYAVRQFFQNGVTEEHIVRTAKNSGEFAIETTK